MLRNRERSVSHYLLTVKTRYVKTSLKSPPQRSINEALDAVNRVLINPACKNFANQKEADGRTELNLDDWAYDRNIGEYYALFGRADANTADVHMLNLTSRSRRSANKTPDEGIEVSAHVLIKPIDRNTALMLITKGAYISADRVVRALHKILNLGTQAKNLPEPLAQVMYAPHPEEAAKKERLRLTFSYGARPNQLLADLLRQERVTEIELQENTFDRFDDDGNLVTKCKSIKLGIEKPSYIAKLVDFKDRVLGADLGINPDRMVLKYKTDEEEYALKALTIRSGAEVEIDFSRMTRLFFDADLRSYCEKIDYSIIAKMRELV